MLKFSRRGEHRLHAALHHSKFCGRDAGAEMVDTGGVLVESKERVEICFGGETRRFDLAEEATGESGDLQFSSAR